LENQHLALLMFVPFVLGILAGFPIAFTLAGIGLIFGAIGLGLGFVGPQMVTRTFGVMISDALVAVPLFIFMGYMIERSGIADKLYQSLQQTLGPLRGSLALATVVLGTILAAAIGIVGASVTLLGLLSLPAMIKRGYDSELATGSVLAAGTLGILIPPSIMLILYGPMAGLSVVRLFAGAIFPGLLLSTLYLAYISTKCLINPRLGPPLPIEERAMPPLKLLTNLLTSIIPPVSLIGAVLGSILFGLAAPTEAAAVGGFGAVVLSACYGRFNWKILKEVVYLTLRTTSMVMAIVVGATIFTGVFLALGGGKAIESFLLWIPLGPIGILILIMVIIFILGMFIDWIAILMILVPIITPIMETIGFDPLWVALLVCINLQTSCLTPPFAYSIFYLQGVAPRGVELEQIYRGIVPFVLLQLIGLALCIVFPQIVLWLPKALYG